MRILEPFKAADKTKFLEFSYIATIVFLLLGIVFTPIFIRHHLLLFKKYVIQEDVVEAVLISILLLIAFILSDIYKKELKKYRQETCRLSRDNCDLSSKLTDAFKYIGGVNIQIQAIQSIFCRLGRYPKTENEFRNDLALFAGNLLGIVNADWVLIRIICQANLRTIKEHLEARKNANSLIKGISNKAIVADRAIDGYSIVASRRDNSMITVACVFPKKCLDQEEKILVEAVNNQIEMLYLIFVSLRQHEIYPNHKPIRATSEKLTT
jgi:uncharacterized membrane protein (DUF485 family)